MKNITVIILITIINILLISCAPNYGIKPFAPDAKVPYTTYTHAKKQNKVNQENKYLDDKEMYVNIDDFY